MATNLLLEGEDLEELLARAHAEAGANARIVRAEKVRRGGFLGFFARPGFEVALEVPEMVLGDLPGAGDADGERDGDAGDGGDGGDGAEDTVGRTTLLTLAERVDAAERAAAKVALAAERAAYAEVEELAARRAGELEDERLAFVAARAAQPVVRSVERSVEQSVEQSVARPVARPVGQFQPLEPARARVAQPGIGSDLVEPIEDREITAVPFEPTIQTIQPAPRRNEFVSMLDHLRLTGRARHRRPDPEPLFGDESQLDDTQLDDTQLDDTDAEPLLEDIAEDPADDALEHIDEDLTELAGLGKHRERDLDEVDEPIAAETAADLVDAVTWHVPSPRQGEPADRPADHAAPQAADHGPQLEREPVLQPLSPPEFLGSEYESLAVIEIAEPAASPLPASARSGDPGAEPAIELSAQPELTPVLAPSPVASIPLPRPASEPASEPAGQPASEPPAEPAAESGAVAPVRRTEPTGPSVEDRRAAEEYHAEQRRAQRRLARDRSTLRALGVPRAWTRRMPAGDRFAAVLAVLERVPEAVIDPDAAVIAVVGPPGVVELEAHRTAVDLHADGRPRPMVTLPTRYGEDRRKAVTAAGRNRPVVVAIPTEGYDDVTGVRRAVKSAKADVVIAVVDAHRSIEDTTRWIEALEIVDAVALEGALEVSDPAAVLQLELPVIRLDGIAIDRIGWAAVLCAQLTAAGPVPVGAEIDE